MRTKTFTLRRLFVFVTLVCIAAAVWAASRTPYFRIRVLGVDGVTVWAVIDPPIVVAFRGVPNDGTSFYQWYEPVTGLAFSRRGISDADDYSEYRWGKLSVVFNNEYHLSVRKGGKLLTVCDVDYSLSQQNLPLVLIVEPDQSVREAKGDEKETLLNKALYRPTTGLPI